MFNYNLAFNPLFNGASEIRVSSTRIRHYRLLPNSFYLYRKITTVEDMYKEICTHIKESSNNGIIIPMISVFPERQPNGKDIVRIWNGQLISYAGFVFSYFCIYYRMNFGIIYVLFNLWVLLITFISKNCRLCHR